MRNLKTLSVLLIALTLSSTAFAQNKEKKSKKKSKNEVVQIQLNNQIDSVSYSVGLNMGASVKNEFSEVHFNALIEGLRAAIEDTNYVLTQEQTPDIIRPYFQKKQEAAQAEEMKKYEQIKIDGQQFLENNKKNPNVKVTPSGLQYIVIEEGTGVQPTATSMVKVHYHGTTPDGTVFDSSVERGEPIEFALNQVIPGWTEGVQLMKEGAKYVLIIPQELAYGANAPQGGQGPIKPFMPLIFEVQLIKVNN
ncbi:MAG: FKBP-type peptidyl-prolyl cis-trans isomerase [Vicingaceae bacterium]|nr:FKBP-type peptidyl-prolyl cis-trans isomerase [Vicingaceae bacterium]